MLSNYFLANLLTKPYVFYYFAFVFCNLVSIKIIIIIIIIKYCLFYARLSGHTGGVVASHASVARSIPAETALINTMHEALRGYYPFKFGGAASQFYLPSLTPLSVAGSGRLQVGVPNWATLVH